jgi:hypothetical protein
MNAQRGTGRAGQLTHADGSVGIEGDHQAV